MTPEQVILLFLQVPLIGVFIIFELIIRKADREEREKRDATFLAFLADQRVTDRNVMAGVVNELNAVKGMIAQHDSGMRQAVTEMRVLTSMKRRHDDEEEK
jgi:hypothetical protein